MKRCHYAAAIMAPHGGKILLAEQCVGTMDCLSNANITSGDSQHHVEKDDDEHPLESKRCTRLRANRRFSTQPKKLQYDNDVELRCGECDYTASDSSSLYLHIRGHTDDRPFKCQYCPYASQSESILTVHTKSHILDTLPNILQPFLAVVENPTTSEPNSSQSEANALKGEFNGNDANFADPHPTAEVAKSVQNAVRTDASDAKKFRCDHAGCTYSTNAAISFKNHLGMHSNKKAVKCKLCLKSFRRSDHCFSHEKLHVKTIRRYCQHGARCDKCEEPLKELLFRCLWCPFTCIKERQLVLHCRSPHKFKGNHGATLEETVTQPPLASEVEIRCEDLHVTMKQNEESPLEDAKLYLTENFLEFPTNTEAPLASSILVVESSSVSSEVNPATDNISAETVNGLSPQGTDEVSSFTTVSTTQLKPTTLARKNRGPSIKATSREFKCNKSGCTFSSTYSKNLILHRLLIHSKSKTENQQKQHARHEEKQQHLRHRGNQQIERPFQCKECSKSFVTNRSLELHERSHTHGFKYRCEECDYGSQYKCNLKLHINKKHKGNHW